MLRNIIIIVLIITNLGSLVFALAQKTIADQNFLEAQAQRTIAEEQRVIAEEQRMLD